MISVLIPVFNAVEYLDKCIESVMNQTYQEFEVILVNDGSTDGSGKVCQRWQNKDKRIKYFEKTNEGIGVTRNYAINMASQPYITFLDADDWWDKNYLLEMLRPIKEQKVDMVVCDIYYVTKNEQGELVYEDSKVRLPENKTLNTTVNKNSIHRVRTFSWGKIYLKSLFTERHMFFGLHAFEDIPTISIITALAQKIYRVAKPLYYYNRFRQGNLTDNEKYYDDVIESLLRTKQLFLDEAIFFAYKQELMRLAYSQIRFVIKKAIHNGYRNVTVLENNLFQCWNQLFPDTFILDQTTYAVVGGKECYTALSNLLIYDKNILWCENSTDFCNQMVLQANCIVADTKYYDALVLKKINSKIIWVDMQSIVAFKKSEKIWEISDIIFNSL